MGEDAVRLLIVLGGGLVVGIFALVFRQRRARTARIIANTGLAPGSYLFTSARCLECSKARATLDGFVEIAWEEQPEVFNRLEVAAVPSTLKVDASGSGTWAAWSPTARNP